MKQASRAPARSTLARAAPLFSALGDATRLNIVSRLSADGAQSVARLTEGTGISRQAVTKHLHTLSAAGLARCVREGRESLWQIDPHRVADARRYLDDIAGRWELALERLKSHVERDDG